jgi:hypothetical protein
MRCGVAARLLLTALWLAVHGCGAAPEGGAVELSWALRDRTLGFVSCTVANIQRIRLDWQVGDAIGFDTWPCDNNGVRQGVTAFTVPVGTASLSILPECPDGPADSNTYEVPAPVQRQVELGGIVTLGAVVVAIELESSDTRPRICP